MATVSSVKIDKTKLTNMIRTSPGKAENFVTALAFEGEGYTKRSFGTSPSAPGDTPGVRTGALRSSIHVESITRFKKAIVAGTDYAIHLEFGTQSISPRPFMTPMAFYLQRQVSRFWGMFVE